RRDEPLCAAFHDRLFGAVDLDQGVVDAKPAQRGQQMLDGGDGSAIAVAEHGAQRYPRHRPRLGRDFGAVSIAIGKEEAYSSIAVGRTESDRYWRSAMHPRPGQ